MSGFEFKNTVGRSNSNSAWKIVRRMQLSHANILENIDQEPSVPVFRKEWDEEYLETSFQPLEIKIFCCISSIYYFLHFLIVVCGNSDDGASGNRAWVTITWLPELFAAIFSICVFAFFTLDHTRKICRQIYDPISAFTIIVSYVAAMLPSVLLEVRRAQFQHADVSQITWGIDFSTFPPMRTCNDTDPLRSHQHATTYATSIGCNNLVISGNIFSIYILHVLLPRIFRNSARIAVIVALATSAGLVAALLAVGTLSHDLAVLFAVAFQLLAGLGAAYFCHVRKLISRQQFVVAKGTKFATEQNRNLLYTLIPQNVVQKLSNHKGAEMLGSEIRECAVMFCSLEPQVELQAASTGQEFNLLDEVFSAFDSAVERHGMFKYQHVRCRPPCNPPPRR
jgi:hypothetical protein